MAHNTYEEGMRIQNTLIAIFKQKVEVIYYIADIVKGNRVYEIRIDKVIVFSISGAGIEAAGLDNQIKFAVSGVAEYILAEVLK